MQADALAIAFKSWRRLWTRKECGGALVWQVRLVFLLFHLHVDIGVVAERLLALYFLGCCGLVFETQSGLLCDKERITTHNIWHHTNYREGGTRAG